MNIFTLKNKVKKTNKKSFSQFSEDIFLLEIFKNNKNLVCIDVGANDGSYGSNSALLEQHGWKCILVEPNAALCKQILVNRKPYKLFEYAASSKESEATLYLVRGGVLAHGLSTLEPNKENLQRIESNNFSYEQTTVKSKTLDSMLIEAELTKVDVVSIDVEGHELEALKGLSFERWNPRIFIIEDNSMFKSKEISGYMANHDYQVFFRTGVNDWYAHFSDSELVNLNNIILYKLTKFSLLLKQKLARFSILRKIVHIFRNH